MGRPPTPGPRGPGRGARGRAACRGRRPVRRAGKNASTSSRAGGAEGRAAGWRRAPAWRAPVAGVRPGRQTSAAARGVGPGRAGRRRAGRGGRASGRRTRSPGTGPARRAAAPPSAGASARRGRGAPRPASRDLGQPRELVRGLRPIAQVADERLAHGDRALGRRASASRRSHAASVPRAGPVRPPAAPAPAPHRRAGDPRARLTRRAARASVGHGAGQRGRLVPSARAPARGHRSEPDAQRGARIAWTADWWGAS
jgi:hypothetical protein